MANTSNAERIATLKGETASLSKHVRTDDGRGFKSVTDGYLFGDVEVLIDWHAVHDMARAALRSKGRKSKAGPITVKAVNVGRMPAGDVYPLTLKD